MERQGIKMSWRFFCGKSKALKRLETQVRQYIQWAKQQSGY